MIFKNDDDDDLKRLGVDDDAQILLLRQRLFLVLLAHVEVCYRCIVLKGHKDNYVMNN